MIKETTVELSAEAVIPLDIRVCMGERIKVKIEPERRALEPQRCGTSLEAPEQQHRLRWEMQRTTDDDCSLVDVSSDLGGTTSLHTVVIGVEPDYQS